MRTIILIADNGISFPKLGSGYNVIKADSAAEGKKLAAENAHLVSIILIDIKTALNCGSDAFAALRAGADGGEIPVAVIAAEDCYCGEDKIKCLEMGASDFISLSESTEVIEKRLDNIIRLHETAGIFGKVERDKLTGAYSKNFFMEYMMRTVKRNPDKQFDLICLEVESYDLIYGRYGVEICDGFMAAMVRGLSEVLPPEVIMGTAEGGHIMFIMPHMPFELHEQTMQGCLIMAAQSPFPLIPINAGVYPCIEPDNSGYDAYSNCLLALENVRYNNEKFIAIYDDEIRQKIQRRKLLEKKMYSALREKHFKVYYQPKYGMRGDTIHGAEALVRWIDPEFGFMSPGEFIPLFEKNGFIFELDKYIIENVCADIRKWLDKGEKAVPVSVNVSQTDFDQKRLDELFETIVDKYNIPHNYIHFEITESAEAPDAIRKSIAVDGLRKRGFEVELDDFGAGYSTLSILKQMPVDVMKIDMSLVRNMSDPHYRAILEGALYTALKLDIHVVVEGVENNEQYNELTGICENYAEPDIQGFYFSKPVPADVFEEKLTCSTIGR